MPFNGQKQKHSVRLVHARLALNMRRRCKTLHRVCMVQLFISRQKHVDGEYPPGWRQPRICAEISGLRGKRIPMGFKWNLRKVIILEKVTRRLAWIAGTYTTYTAALCLPVTVGMDPSHHGVAKSRR
jgi:hypothetical protein